MANKGCLPKMVINEAKHDPIHLSRCVREDNLEDISKNRSNILQVLPQFDEILI